VLSSLPRSSFRQSRDIYIGRVGTEPIARASSRASLTTPLALLPAVPPRSFPPSPGPPPYLDSSRVHSAATTARTRTTRARALGFSVRAVHYRHNSHIACPFHFPCPRLPFPPAATYRLARPSSFPVHGPCASRPRPSLPPPRPTRRFLEPRMQYGRMF